MILTTTNNVEGRKAKEYIGIVTGEVILGANLFKDFLASLRDIVGGRSGAYERVLKEGKENALREITEKAQAMGANAIIGISLDYETLGANGSMLMVSASGTAVILEQ